MPQHRKNKNAARKTPEYQEFLGKMRKLFDEAAAQGVDMRKRDDILTCRACGAYEDELAGGQRVICDRERHVLGGGEFILIDRKERCTYRKNAVYFKMTYEFICLICGAQQAQVIREHFDNIR